MTHATQQWRIEIEETPEEEEFSLEDGEWLPMAESILLKQAEEVVDEVQDTINHMASLPVNPEELTSKLNAILSNYSIFKNTEYFQAINNYVILAAKRDCDIELSDATVNQLWL
ncbi:hypothetical protein FLA_0442 [Filimonas lacunae]|nr:hypothetical protein FLA_0442 [Filimonas lacunae]